MAVKIVKFQYFIPKATDPQTKIDTIFDFNRWLDKATHIEMNNRIRECKGIKARLDKNIFYDKEGLWGVRFMRLRDDNIPFIVKVDADAEDLELREDEYVGEGLHIIYDPKYQFCMIQSNRFSLGVTTLEGYLNAVWDTPAEIIHLQPFQKTLDLANYQRNEYKTLKISFANLDSLRQGDRRFRCLEGVLDGFKQIGCYNAEIKFSLGHSRQPTLNRDEVHCIFEEICDNRDIVSGAKISCKDYDYEKSEIIDLLDCVEESRINFNLPERETLGHEYAFNEMIQEYNRKKEVLLAHL